MTNLNDAPAALRGRCVVICEDEGLTLMQITRVLTRAGMVTVGVARTGQECVDLAREYVPDVVITDIGLDGELDGLEAARLILEHQPAICVVGISGNSTAQMKQRASDLGMQGFLVKPFTSQELVDQLCHACPID